MSTHWIKHKNTVMKKIFFGVYFPLKEAEINQGKRVKCPTDHLGIRAKEKNKAGKGK